MRGRGWGMRQFSDASPQSSLRGKEQCCALLGTPGPTDSEHPRPTADGHRLPRHLENECLPLETERP